MCPGPHTSLFPRKELEEKDTQHQTSFRYNRTEYGNLTIAFIIMVTWYTDVHQSNHELLNVLSNMQSIEPPVRNLLQNIKSLPDVHTESVLLK